MIQNFSQEEGSDSAGRSPIWRNYNSVTRVIVFSPPEELLEMIETVGLFERRVSAESSKFERGPSPVFPARQRNGGVRGPADLYCQSHLSDPGGGCLTMPC